MGTTGECTGGSVEGEMQPQRFIGVLSLPLAIWDYIIFCKYQHTEMVEILSRGRT